MTGEFALCEEALERDETVVPLKPLSPVVAQIGGALLRPGAGLPLVVATVADRAFRASEPVWVEAHGVQRIETLDATQHRLGYHRAP